jgi:hypothetical protein
LLLPAFAPAESAGLRAGLDTREVACKSFRGEVLFRSRPLLRDAVPVLLAGLPVWPLRWLTAAVAGFPLRAPLV